MRAVRFLTFALLLVVGFAGTAGAQGYNNTPGTYDVKIAVTPALIAQLPPGSLPGVSSLGPDLFVGQLVVTKVTGGFYAQFKGSRDDGAKLNAQANFNDNWAGFKLGSALVGTSLETDCVLGIDGANLINANINGVGTVNHENRRVIARFTAGPTLVQYKELKEPGYLR